MTLLNKNAVEERAKRTYRPNDYVSVLYYYHF